MGLRNHQKTPLPTFCSLSAKLRDDQTHGTHPASGQNRTRASPMSLVRPRHCFRRLQRFQILHIKPTTLRFPDFMLR